MKAGIVTFHKADNYGAVLQAYALQKTLEKLGVCSEFLEFSEAKKDADSPNNAASKGPLAFAAKLREAGKKRNELFNAFRDKYLKCSSALPTDSNDEQYKSYDIFITGSDQVWSLRLPESDERYFLPFAPPEKRVSYAASFGTSEIPDELKEWYAERLKGFKSVSVREESGKELVKELTGRECEVCLDPVLLLNREDWKSLIAPTGDPPYIFLYMVGYDADLAARAKREAEERGLALRTVTAGFIPQFGISSWSDTGVEQWLSLIYNSSGVFTNSFHCTAFAFVFGRPVETAMLKEGLESRNGRLEEIIRLGGVSRGETDAVSAEDFEERIRDKKQSSVDYLHSALGLNSL